MKRSKTGILDELKKVYASGGLWKKGMWSIFKTKMLINHSKANLEENILLGKITHLSDLTIRKIPVRGLYGDCIKRTMYADDTTISYSSNNIDDLNDNLNRDLNCLKQWLQGNKLSLNVIKTQAMVVGSRPNLKKISEGNVQSPSFAIGDSQIEIVEKTKYLGIQLDKHLFWDEHTRFLRAKVSRAIGFLKYAKTILPQETLSQIYRGIVEPHFRYCCSVWGSCGESRRLTLQKLQNRAARIVTNSSYDAPADDLIQQLKWPNIAEIIKRETATIVYKSLNGLAPTYLSNIFSKNSSRRTVKLRNSETDLRIPLYKTSNGQKSFSYRGVHLWNSLEPEVKQAPSLYAFKHRL